MLSVDSALIAEHGTVSLVMTLNAMHRSHVKMTLAVTGVAGPRGGSDDKPVHGVVCMGHAQ